MNDTTLREKPSKRLRFAIIWSIVAITVAIYLAVRNGEFTALLIILAFAPLSILSVRKMDVVSQRTLRDNAVIKDKSSKAADSASKSLQEIKAVRSRTKIVSARNTRILENINKLNKSVNHAIAQKEGEQLQLVEAPQEVEVHSSQAKVIASDLQKEWNRFLEDYARISHFSSAPHSHLSASQLKDVSNLLDIFGVSDIILLAMEPIPEYNRVLQQSHLDRASELTAHIPSDNKPFLIITELNSLATLRREAAGQLETLNAAYVVPQPLDSDTLQELGFTRIPTEFKVQSVEFICPVGLIRTNEH